VAKRLLFLLLISLIGVAIVQLIGGMRERAALFKYPMTGDRYEVDGTRIHIDVRHNRGKPDATGANHARCGGSGWPL